MSRLQACRPRSMFEAGGLGSSLPLGATNRCGRTPDFTGVTSHIGWGGLVMSRRAHVLSGDTGSRRKRLQR
jgi:hypothetical protein